MLIRVVSITAVVLLLGLAVACSVSSPVAGTDTRIPQPQLESALPPLPDDTDREPAATATLGLRASQTYDRSGNATDDGISLELVSAAGELAWGMWCFNPADGVPESLEIRMMPTGGAGVYTALSNYDKMSWEISGPYFDDATLPASDPAYRSPSGNTYLAAMVWDGDTADVIRIDYTYENNWDTTVVVSDGEVGQFASLVIVDGNPAISFFAGGSDLDLKYVRAGDTTGTVWGEPVTVASAGQVGAFSSMAIVEGHPAISFGEDFVPALYYARASDSTGTDWGVPVNADPTAIATDTHLVVVNGNPAIAYYDVFNPAGLKYVRATDAAGTTWGPAQRLEAGTDRGRWPSLIIEGTIPAIACYDGSINSPVVYRAQDADGGAWNLPETIDDSTDDSGLYLAGAAVNGHLAVSYFNDTAMNLMYAWYDSTLPGWQVEVAATYWRVGLFPSLAVVGGVPAVSSYDAYRGDLYYSTAEDADGTVWNVGEVVESPGFVGGYSSLLEIEGRPAIAYWDATNGDLKFAILSE